MTRAKADITLAPRVRAYPDAEGCAAEFACSPNTWLGWVRDGDVPPAVPGLEPPRWRWADVDAWISDPASRDAIRRRYAAVASAVAVATGAVPGDPVDPFMAGIRGPADGTKKGRRRGTAA